MNTNPKATTVLCFGDSNTHGSRPDGSSRYTADERWTGKLQHKLGLNYYVIEEGLGGRTTNLEHPRTEKPGRNGLVYFRSCLESHEPLNVVIVMLGTNDFKNVYDRSAKEVAEVLDQFIDSVEEISTNASVILVSPSYITATEPVEYYDTESEKKSRELAPEIEALTKKRSVMFLDAGKIVQTGEDGLHWDVASGEKFAEAISVIVRSIK